MFTKPGAHLLDYGMPSKSPDRGVLRIYCQEDGVVIANRPYTDTYLFVIWFWSVTETSCDLEIYGHVGDEALMAPLYIKFKYMVPLIAGHGTGHIFYFLFLQIFTRTAIVSSILSYLPL
jgi:hypothetical protein